MEDRGSWVVGRGWLKRREEEWENGCSIALRDIMAKHRRSFLDTILPKGDARKPTSELIERGLEALRIARDERGLSVGSNTLVPSRLELRLPQMRYDELAEMGAVRDVEYYFNDELMKDLAAEKLRTFGDHPVYVTIAADSSLQPNEIYAAVMSPEGGAFVEPAMTPAPFDRTSVLGEQGLPPIPPRPEAAVGSGLRLTLRGAGVGSERTLEGTRWIIGRQGSSGRPLPDGYRKVDLDLPPTVSREQVRVDLIGGDRLRIERIGKAPMTVHGGERLGEGENRLVPVGAPFQIEDREIVISW